MFDELEETTQDSSSADSTKFNSDGTVKLNNRETAAQYKCTYTWIIKIHVPGVWAGLISDVPPNVAAILIKQGHKAFVKIEQ